MLKNESITETNAVKSLAKLKRNLIFTTILALTLIILIGVIIYQHNKIVNPPISPVVDPVSPEIVLDVINSEIKSIGELATTEYNYTNAAKFSDSKQINNWNIPFTEKSFIIRYSGVIKAGIDVEAIDTSADSLKKVITVRIPKAKILSHDIDTASAEILSEKDGWLNDIKLDDKLKFDEEMEKEMEQRAEKDGLLTKAQQNAEEIIARLLNANPTVKGSYTIEFKTIE